MNLAFVGDSAYWDNMSIRDNVFTNYDVEFRQRSGRLTPRIGDGIYWRADVNSVAKASTNINFYNNTFTAHAPGGIGYEGGTSGLYLEGPVFANIYNNVYVGIQPANGYVVAHSLSEETLRSTPSTILRQTFTTTRFTPLPPAFISPEATSTLNGSSGHGKKREHHQQHIFQPAHRCRHQYLYISTSAPRCRPCNRRRHVQF